MVHYLWKYKAGQWNGALKFSTLSQLDAARRRYTFMYKEAYVFCYRLG